jgi:O-antigen/teichoic acid export membrane protein
VANETKRPSVVRHVLLSSLSNYIGKLISLGLWFVLTPFILSQLGDRAYGLWALVGSVAAYGFLFNIGITDAVTKYVAEYHAQGEDGLSHDLIATGLWVNTCLGLLVIAISVLLAPLFSSIFNMTATEQSTAIWLFLFVGVGVAITIPCAVASAVLRGLQRFDLLNLIGVSATLVTAAATVLVLLLGGGVIGLAIVGIAVTILIQLISIWIIYRIAPELRFGWYGASRSNLRLLISYSSSLFFMNLGGYLETRSDEMVIGGFLPVREVTPYNLARRLSALPQTLTEQFLTLLLPMASELHSKDDSARLRSLYMISTRVTLAIFLPIGMILIVLAKPILTVWVGTAYADYSYLILILVVASLIDTSTWPAGFVLQGMAKHKPLAIMTIGAGVTNLALSILLVNQLGLIGVALGSLVPTIIVCTGFVTPYAMRVIGVSAREMYTNVLRPALFPSIPMCMVTIVLREVTRPSSFLLIAIIAAIGSLSYLAIYLFTRGNEYERDLIHRILINIVNQAKLYLKLPEWSNK